MTSVGRQVRRKIGAVAVLSLALGAAACEKAQLLAPASSTIVITAASRTVMSGGTTEITAFVTESAGTPVPNGTTVRFVTSLGRVEPVETQTRNGVATTTFVAGNSSGVAEVRAVSGGATGGTGDAATNVVEITVGAANVASVTVSGSPGTVPPSGGMVTLVAVARDGSGNRLTNLPITFSTTAGTLSSTVATTDANGEARVTLTTDRNATVTASAGAETATFAVTAAVGNSVSFTLTPNPSQVDQPVTASLSPTIGTNNNPSTVVINWGDGTGDENLGVVAAPRSASHVYRNQGVYTVTVTQGSGADTFLTSAAQVVNLRTGVGVSITQSPAGNPTQNQTVVTFTAALTGDTTAAASSFRWDFLNADGSQAMPSATTTGNSISRVFPETGLKTVRATVNTTDGRTGTGELLVNVQAPPP